MPEQYTNSYFDENNFPRIPKELLERIEKCFPKFDFSPQHSLREIDFYSGQRKVVSFLRHMYEVQNENIISNNID